MGGRMKDRVIEGLVTDFANDYNISNLKESEQFEHLINFCILSGEKDDDFDLNDIHVGEKGNYGLDGVVILLDDRIVTTVEEVDEVLAKRKSASVKYIFVQSKTSDSFDTGDVLKEFSAINAFLKEKYDFPFNESCKELIEVSAHIASKASMISVDVVCRIYYATTGMWVEDNFIHIIEDEKEKISNYNIFSKIEFIPLGGKEIKQKYKETKNKISKDINFVRKATLPKIEGVNSSFIGVIPAKDYIELITDSSGNILRSIFFDNIRDFLGDNPVNSDISETLNNKETCGLFPVLNNGVTIVSRRLKPMGDILSLYDFQVVNGCQTSNILFRNKDNLNDSIFLPLKIIITNDDDVISRIVMATNSQTEIKKEAFESLLPFHKELEQYYRIASSNYCVDLYYERRQRQYTNDNINKNRIITLSAQTKSYVAMFLNYPHSVHKYYGTTLKDFYTALYKESHDLLPYYLSTAFYYKINKFFNNQRYSNYRAFKFYILYSLKVLFIGTERFSNSKSKPNKNLGLLIKMLTNDTILGEAILKILPELSAASRELHLSPYKAVLKKDFTDKVTEKISKMAKTMQDGNSNHRLRRW